MLMPESRNISSSYVKVPELQPSVQEWIEQNKRDKEEWEKQNPALVQKLRQKDANSTLTVKKILPEIEKLCGIPNDSRYKKMFEGTVDVYTYSSGDCRGRTLFDTGYELVLTNAQ